MDVNRVKRTVVSALFSAALFVQIAAMAQSRSLAIGAQDTLDFDSDIAKVRVDKPGVVELNVELRKLKVTGVGRGTALIEVFYKNGTSATRKIIVGPKDISVDPKQSAAAELGKVPGVSANVVGDSVVATGVITNQKDEEQFSRIKARYSNLVVDKVQSSFRKTDLVIKAINGVLLQNKIVGIRAENLGDLKVLLGSPKDADEQALAVRLARTIDPNIVDGIRKDMTMADAVNIDVVFIETSTSNNLEFGMNGITSPKLESMTTTPAPAAPAAASNAFAGAATQAKKGKFGNNVTWSVAPLEFLLHLVQSRSSSRVLSNPRIVARSGQQAHFHSGGTVYLLSTNKGLQGPEKNVQTIDYGMQLEILPKLDRLMNIDTTIKASVSDIVPSASADQAGRSITEVQTAVSLQDGYSVLLSGFRNTRDRKQVSRVPLLADIPVLGELFKSRVFGKDMSELMVLLSIRKIEVNEEASRKLDSLSSESSSAVSFSLFD